MTCIYFVCFFSLSYFVTATFALSKTANPPKPILLSLFFPFQQICRMKERVYERKKERETHMLTYQTNDGKRYNTNFGDNFLKLIFFSL